MPSHRHDRCVRTNFDCAPEFGWHPQSVAWCFWESPSLHAGVRDVVELRKIVDAPDSICARVGPGGGRGRAADTHAVVPNGSSNQQGTGCDLGMRWRNFAPLQRAGGASADEPIARHRETFRLKPRLHHRLRGQLPPSGAVVQRSTPVTRVIQIRQQHTCPAGSGRAAAGAYGVWMCRGELRGIRDQVGIQGAPSPRVCSRGWPQGFRDESSAAKL